MSAKKPKRTVKSASKKPAKAKTTRTTRTKKKPEKEVPPEVEKPEIEPEEPKVEAEPLETEQPLREVEQATKPIIEVETKPKEITKPEIAQPQPEPETESEASPALVETIIVETPQRGEHEPEKAAVEVRTEPKPPLEVKRETKKRAAVRPLPKPLPKKKLPQPPKDSMLLIIRLRGTFAVPTYIDRTLQSLRLRNKYNATLARNSPGTIGMLRQVKDYVTWGDLQPGDVAKLLRKRGEVNGGKRVTDKVATELFSKENIDSLATALATGEIGLQSLWERGVKPVFRLRPPSGGFESTIKRPFTSNGQLGYRGSAIATLMTKMS